LFKLAARVSTVLCVLALALSFRSHWRNDRVRYTGADWTASLTSDDGTIRAQYIANNQSRRAAPGWSYASGPASRTSVSFDGTAYEGFGHAVGRFPQRAAGAAAVHRWWAPHWAFILAAAILPAAYAVRRRLALQRADALCCPSCGRDIRDTPDHCPVCGVVAVEEGG
jgi:hypothetical protein